jgi:peptidoglycan/LPS O-acetylase OafA/YrhL
MSGPLPTTTVGIASGVGDSNRRYDIQGLRAIAVLMVVAFHAGLPVPGGFVGVDVFFVISGFVITAMLHREWHLTGRIRFGRFYLRRFKRLTPALALMVAATMVVSAAVLSPLGTQQTAAKTAIGAILLAANFVIARTTGGYFDASAETNPLLNTWSLSVEEQFYLTFPAIIAFGWLLARRRGALRFSPMVLVSGVAAVSFALALAGSMGFTFRGSGTILTFYSPFTRAWEFAVGALLVLILAKRAVNAPRLLTAGGLFGAAMLAASLWLITGTTPFPGPWTLFPVTGTLLLLLAGTEANAPSTRLLSKMPMVRIGDWSYSIYLWHGPFIVFAGLLWPGNAVVLVAAALVSLVPALASFHYVEEPLRRLNVAHRSLGPLVLAIVVPPLALSIALLLFANHGWYSAPVQGLTNLVRMHAGFENGCFSATPQSPLRPQQCMWNAGDRGAPIYLVGDSHGDQFTEAIAGAGRILGRPVYSYTKSGCPFLDVWVRIPGRSSDWPDGCRSYYDDTTQWLRTQPPGVVINGFADFYWHDDSVEVGGSKDAMTTLQARKAAALEVGLKSSLSSIEAIGHEVLVPLPIPIFSEPYSWDLGSCTLLRIARGECTVTMPLAHADRMQSDSLLAATTATRDAGATLLNLRGALCPDGVCGGPNGQNWNDGSHISVDASAALAGRFAQAIRSLGARVGNA